MFRALMDLDGQGVSFAAALGARKPSERKRMSDFVERKLTMLEDADA